MIVYRKSDGKEFQLRDAVRYKSLWKRAERMQLELNAFQTNLKVQCEDFETREHLFKAERELAKFKENLSLKWEIEQ